MTNQEKRKLIRKWSKVIPCEIGAPITTQEEASKLAVILESEVKLNPDYLKKLEEDSKIATRIEKMTTGLYTYYLNQQKSKI